MKLLKERYGDRSGGAGEWEMPLDGVLTGLQELMGEFILPPLLLLDLHDGHHHTFPHILSDTFHDFPMMPSRFSLPLSGSAGRPLISLIGNKVS
jgi:hypothetical protein